ncbi:hypothetical protein COLO4_17904 [Corchorus olitorius]|uniref:Uncharacterized protein n=1 Tax=Corchorus olitorius TaxID=93759 RepID=A0A1R3JBA7_9ROSI|nr:hypothetical protein COLO4_17904 [Corchorus olitorius]
MAVKVTDLMAVKVTDLMAQSRKLLKLLTFGRTMV